MISASTSQPVAPAGGILAGLVLLFVTFLSAAPARGADDPLALAFVDATPARTGQPFERFRGLLEESSRVSLGPAARLFDDTRETALRRRIFRTRDRIFSHGDRIARSLRRADLEALLVYRQTDDGPELLAIGPQGELVAENRVPTDGDSLDATRAAELLEAPLRKLAPRIRKFRRDRVAGSGATASRRLEPRFSIAAGPTAGRRSLSLTDPSRAPVLQHRTPFFGGRARAAFTPGWLTPSSIALEVVGSGHYGRFRTEITNSGRLRRGSVIYGRGSLRLLWAVSGRLVLFGELGGSWLDVGLEDNPRYVGSSYLTGLGGIGGSYRFGTLGTFEISLDALPTIRTSTNDGRLGPAPLTVGAGGRARFSLDILAPFHIGIHYGLDIYRPRHPDPDNYDQPITGTDFIHVVSLAAAYRL